MNPFVHLALVCNLAWLCFTKAVEHYRGDVLLTTQLYQTRNCWSELELAERTSRRNSQKEPMQRTDRWWKGLESHWLTQTLWSASLLLIKVWAPLVFWHFNLWAAAVLCLLKSLYCFQCPRRPQSHLPRSASALEKMSNLQLMKRTRSRWCHKLLFSQILPQTKSPRWVQPASGLSPPRRRLQESLFCSLRQCSWKRNAQNPTRWLSALLLFLQAEQKHR